MTAVSATTPRDRPNLRRLVLAALVALLVVVLVALPSFVGEYWLLVGYQIAQLAALALAWNLMAGYGGLVALSVSAFVGLGSYAAAKLTISAGFAVIPSLLAGGVVAALFALVVAVPMFRFRGPYFTIASLVLASALAVFMVNYNGLGGTAGLTMTNIAPTTDQLYLLALGVAAVAVVAAVLVLRSRLGIGLLAIRDDEDVAERMGVRTFRIKLVAFLLASFVMGTVGALQAQRLGQVEPYGAFGLSWTIDTINAAIIGGIGTIVGPLVGAAAAVGLAEWLAGYPEVHVLLTGVILIAVIRFVPRGLWGGLMVKLRTPLMGAFPAWLVPRSSGVALGAAPLEREEELPDAAAPPERAAPAAGDHAVLLEATGVGKAFGGVAAVQDVSIALRAGEVLGLVGPNGAGKSTLIGLLSGAHAADGGTVRLFGQDVTGAGARERAALGVGRTHQVPRPFTELTVMQNLLVAQMHGAGAHRADAEREAARILERCGLADVAATRAGDLGLLRLKRLEVARALALRPRILLLDEVGAGLVESELRELIALIRALRAEVDAILVVEHILDVIRECCDRLVVLDRGQTLVSGEPEATFADPRVTEVYLGSTDAAPSRDRQRRVPAGPLLELDGVAASYGSFSALQDVTLAVGAGEVLALVGANGAGKTTTARAVSGMLAPSTGEIRWKGERIDGRPAHEIMRLGIAHCMEGRQIFADLSVEENLQLAGRGARDRRELARRVDEVFELFPILRDKRADPGTSLSGGQQQMLAIGRTLMARPELILFDEISLGLAPIACDQLYAALAEINDRGVAMLVIEQNVQRGLTLADRVAVIEKGRVALEGEPDAIRRDPRLVQLYVGGAA